MNSPTNNVDTCVYRQRRWRHTAFLGGLCILIYIFTETVRIVYSYYNNGDSSITLSPWDDLATYIAIALVFARAYPYINTVELIDETLRLQSPYMTIVIPLTDITSVRASTSFHKSMPLIFVRYKHRPFGLVVLSCMDGAESLTENVHKLLNRPSSEQRAASVSKT